MAGFFITISTENETVTVLARMDEGEGFQGGLSLIETDGWLLTNQLGSTFAFTRRDEHAIIFINVKLD